MTLSRSNQTPKAPWLIAIGLCGIAGVAAAQDAGTRYAQSLADADITARYNGALESQLRSQQSEIASLQQQIAGLEATAADVQPMLQKMFESLEMFVAADVPFLAKEREQRVGRLRDLMSQATTSSAEKFRRLLEAYMIEVEYGRTMGSYREMLGDGREAEFVRLGRISLMYRTVDGQEVGYWDRQQKKWVVAPEYKRSIEAALKIAKQLGAPDLITVPVPAAQAGRS
jgi:hypothetical protein